MNTTTKYTTTDKNAVNAEKTAYTNTNIKRVLRKIKKNNNNIVDNNKK